ncbi:Pyridoxal phosphate-dependent transferase major region subdomain 1 [Penicillium expansum]|nr:Pyridoxal phosphate-dependent transferase major region subdomain 1 [Penicillium expansum]
MNEPRNGISPHNVISSYFIGPKSENMGNFRANITAILDQIEKTRSDYQPNDDVFITEDVRTSPEFQQITQKFHEAVKKAVTLLGKHSIPFWHPRYEGHMCTDMTMPGLLGYFMTMIYNPNNVTVEASPFTTVIELRAGKQLCDMFGYNTDPEESNLPLSWGHITCDGTVANLESIWVARNLKFYPLTLYQAMKEGSLGFIADSFYVTTCVGEEKLFKNLGNWELLNLRPDVILGMGDALYEQYGITSKFLESALTPFSIQTTGKDVLEREFNLTKPTKYFLAQTRHYSWPKGGAIAGIGSANMEGVELDMDGHISIEALERELNRCLAERQAVYAVVAIIGSTEEGEVDPLYDILAMRRRFQDKGLSFLVHADAAWGGYFASMIPRTFMAPGRPTREGDGDDAVISVPSLSLKCDTIQHMIALKEADTITVDPHKAGYIPYPAGSLCYRDGRMRFLVTWTSPYLTQGSLENIGVYGVEGSKPGAAAMAAWLSNQTIGLDPYGYGMLLGEAAFTSARLSAYYAAMQLKQPREKEIPYYIIVPFNRLPIERDGFDILSKEADERRELIWNKVLTKDNKEVSNNPAAMSWLREIGSDLNINAFALNWYDAKGNINTDLEEANYLTRRVVNKLSITRSTADPSKIPLFLTSTQFEPALYGKCAQNFMKRLQLEPCAQDLWVLRNVVMSPFPTERGFIDQLMQTLEETIIHEVQTCRKRNSPTEDQIEFLLRGTDEVFLDFQTGFHRATKRQQIILAVELDDNVKKQYIALREKFPSKDIGFESKDPVHLENLMCQIHNTTQPPSDHRW